MAQSLPRHISKILLGIFLAFVLGVAVIGYRYYESQRRHIRQDYQTSLTAIAHLKVAEISQWRKERLSDGRSISENPLILDNLREIVAHRLPKQDLRKIAAWFQSYTSEHEYKCISLKNSRGNNLVGEDSESQISSRDIALIQEAVTTKVPIFSDLHHDADSTQVSMDMVFPIVARPTRDSAADAVVFLRIDAERNFYPMIRSWPEPAQTSEALLVERSGDEILYLNMPRYDKNPALSLKRPLSDTRLLGALALADSEGIAEGVDYRGVPVLGSLNKIPHSPWRLIAKIDLEEVYGQIRERLQMVVAFAIILICAAASGVGLIWKHQRSVYYRKNLELELKRRLVEQHFDQMMDHANDGIVIIDLEGRIVDANEKAMSLYGYSKGELPGRNISDTVALESRAEIQQRMTEVRKHNGMVFESIHQRKDDSRFPVEVSSRVVEVEGHQFYQNIIRDISARKTAEEALRRVERRFRSLIENASDLIIVLSPEGTFVFASPSVERILGIPLDTLRQRRLEEFIHPDDRAATLTMQEHALKTAGRTFILEHRLKAANSGWLNLESLVKYVVSPDGGGELIINARDTTERTQADEALRFSEEKFSKAFLTSPDAISINRLKDGKFLEVNDGFVNLTGYSREEVLGRSSVEINVWALPGDRVTFVKQLVKTGELEDFEADFLLKDGSRRVGLVSGKIMDVQNEPWILSITRDITERKRAEKFLVENEERMRVALKGANIAVFNQGPDLRYTWIYNPMMGLSANHAIGKTDWEIHPASKGVEKIVALKESVLKSGRGARSEICLEHGNMKTYFDLTVEPLRNDKGETIGITGATLDTTMRKEAEEQLHLQRAYFQQLFESAPEAIVLLRADERIIQVNREFTRLFGYTQEEAVDRQINDLIVPANHKEEGLMMTRRVAGGSVINAESVRRRKDGTVVDVSILGRPVHVNGGQIAVYAIYRDITDRKKAEDALRKSEFSFRGLFNSVGDAIYIQDREGRFVDVNQGAVKMYGFPREYFIGKSPADLSAPNKNDLTQMTDLVRKAFEGDPQQFEFWGVRKNGEVFPKEVRVTKGMYFGEDVIIALAQDITERKKFEAAIQQTNRTLESLIKASPLAITVMDPECRIQLWNPAAERMFGWKAEEVIGRFNPIVPENKKEEFALLHRRALSGEMLHELEVRRQRKDGTLMDISRSTALLRDSEGTIKGIMAVLLDITERKHAEEKLRESEERLRLALTAANMMSWELQVGTGTISWSESGEKFYGLKANEFGGTWDAYLQLIHPDDRAAAELAMNQSIRDGNDFKAEYRIVWPDGSVHWHAAYGRPSREEHGRPVRVSGIGLDISERKKAEEAIQKLHHAVEQTDEVIIMTEPDGMITYVNPAFEKLYRYSREEAIGKTPRILKSGGMSQEYYELFWRDLLAGKSVRAEHINKTKDGKIVIVEASVNPVYDVKGKLSGFIAVQEDISDRKRNESERKKLEAQLLQTQKLESIGTLAGGIAHDFNNILGIILAYSSSLRNANLPHEKVSGAADVINQAVERGADLVKQILTFARKTDVVYGLININVMIKELRRMLAETFPKTITIATDLGADVPDITADATQVHQAILNICVNARDAMPAGGKLMLRTQLGMRAEVSKYFPEATSERYIRVSISDTGSGMDESTRQRIFEPFFTTKPKGKGTGLGLSVVYGVVKNHNGFVRLESEIGRGTTFHLYFPAPVHSFRPLAQVQGSVVEIPGGNECILIVEDEEPLLNVLSGLLTSKGYRVFAAHDGYEAVETYEEHHKDISVVVSDLGLPKMTGQDAFLRMKSVNPKVKVIFGTGYLDPDLKTELLNLGARGFLSKPYSQDELLKRIRDLIDVGE